MTQAAEMLPLAGSHPKIGVTAVTPVTASNDEALSVTADVPQPVTPVTEEGPPAFEALELEELLSESAYPDENQRPCWRCIADWSVTKPDGTKLRPGVWLFTLQTDKETKLDSPVDRWVATPIEVTNKTHDSRGENYGRLMRFLPAASHRWKSWAMPMEMMASRDVSDVFRVLLNRGVETNRQMHTALVDYLQRVPDTKAPVITCATQVGWHGSVFVLPDECIGPKSESFTFQALGDFPNVFSVAGTLPEWQREISAYAVGNPLLTLAISSAFTAPLLERLHMDGGGVHIFGPSSLGKSTLLSAARSVWGGRSYQRSWKATANGMEGVAVAYNDCLLPLDEISECDPREIGAIVYAQANGVGKSRANRSGNAKTAATWRSFILSNGERSVAAAMAEGGHIAKAGQEVRMVSLSGDRQHGIWDDLRGHSKGHQLSDHIKDAAQTYYGIAAREFLQRLTIDAEPMGARLEAMKKAHGFHVPDFGGQAARVSARFAAMAVAGELATAYGITGWADGMATEHIRLLFRQWLDGQGQDNHESRELIQRLQRAIEMEGSERFSLISECNAEARIRSRLGWWREDVSLGRVYLFTASGIKELLRGLDYKPAMATLDRLGVIVDKGSGERAKTHRTPEGSAKLYSISARRLAELATE